MLFRLFLSTVLFSVVGVIIAGCGDAFKREQYGYTELKFRFPTQTKSNYEMGLLFDTLKDGPEIKDIVAGDFPTLSNGAEGIIYAYESAIKRGGIVFRKTAGADDFASADKSWIIPYGNYKFFTMVYPNGFPTSVSAPTPTVSEGVCVAGNSGNTVEVNSATTAITFDYTSGINDLCSATTTAPNTFSNNQYETPLKISTCGNNDSISTKTISNDDCSDPNGQPWRYIKVKMVAANEFAGELDTIGMEGIESQCIDTRTSSPYKSKTSALFVPPGNPTNFKGLGVVVKFYSNNDCSTNTGGIYFKRGLKGAAATIYKTNDGFDFKFIPGTSAANYSALYIDAEP